jgi:hypothetical protein
LRRRSSSSSSMVTECEQGRPHPPRASCRRQRLLAQRTKLAGRRRGGCCVGMQEWRVAPTAVQPTSLVWLLRSLDRGSFGAQT